MKKAVLAIFIFLQVCLYPSQAQHSTFVSKDIFQSAVFIKNEGIVEDLGSEKILYYACHDNINAFFTENGLIYQVKQLRNSKKKDFLTKNKREEKDVDADRGNISVRTSYIKMTWGNANPHPVIVAEHKATGYHTYLKRVGALFKTLIGYGYKSITYKDLYPGIDVEYTFPEGGGMEYNLIVHPGANVDDIKINYSGGIKTIKGDEGGNILIKTKAGDIFEHAPVSYINNQLVPSLFRVNKKQVHFFFPGGYDKTQMLTIDPWVQALTIMLPKNMGFNTDYDLEGNLFVYGAGPTDPYDYQDYYNVAKYDSNGSLVWIFSTDAPGLHWIDPYQWGNSPGNFIVDKVSGKVYIGKAFDANGTYAIRVNAAGAYDNFVTEINPYFQEIWGFAYNCTNGTILALGGGTSSDLTMGIINTITDSITTTNITGLTGTNGDYNNQDIVCGAYDTNGNLYVIMNSSVTQLPYANPIYKVNSSFNGHTLLANSNYSTFFEAQNRPFFGTLACNWSNCLAANGSYLYYFDGARAAAYTLSNGTQLGSVTISANALQQSGIAVDNCNNLYIGSTGKILTYTFDGTNFVANTPISLGAGFTGTNIYDVRYNKANNLLYVTGNGIVGTFPATLSDSCNPIAPLTMKAEANCASASVTISPAKGLNPAAFNYIWTDTANNIISQLNYTTDTINTVTGLPNGTYNVQVLWNINSGQGYALSGTVSIYCATLAVAPDTTICEGQSVILRATPSTTGGTYNWSPGGDTTSAIMVTPYINSAYVVTYTLPGGPQVSDTINVNVDSITAINLPDSSICSSDSVSICAPAGFVSYQWNISPETSNCIWVSETGNYYVTVSDAYNCTAESNHAIISLHQAPAITLPDTTICSNDSVSICVPAGFKSYTWNMYADTTNCIWINEAGTYSVTVSDANNCTAESNQAAISIYPALSVTLPDTTICSNDSVFICAPAGFKSYQWNIPVDTGNCIWVNEAGDYYVTVSDANNCTAESNHSVISVFAVASVPIVEDGDTLSSFGAISYQWFLNDDPINGDTFDFHVADKTGAYMVETTDSNGCIAFSNTIAVSISGIRDLYETGLEIFPNPSVNGKWELLTNNGFIGNRFEIYDDNGRKVYQSEIQNTKTEILLNLAPGIYILNIITPNQNIIRRLVNF